MYQYEEEYSIYNNNVCTVSEKEKLIYQRNCQKKI